jgi:outer membrane lipoprotein LolB
MILVGCASIPSQRPPVADPELTWQTRQLELRPLKSWEIRGRLAMRTAEEGWQASLRWVRKQEQHNIDLMGPLGRGHLRLTQDRHGAELRDADRQTYRDSSVQQLLWRATGWNVPLEGLNYWVLGLPVPDAPWTRDLDEWGRLKVLQQQGWEIEFLQYTRHGAHELPSKLFIKRQLSPSEDIVGDSDDAETTLEVRLVIDRWALNK